MAHQLREIRQKTINLHRTIAILNEKQGVMKQKIAKRKEIFKLKVEILEEIKAGGSFKSQQVE
jgi:hypothetical protein